jgi:two-component system CheB/CheR fusion protein
VTESEIPVDDARLEAILERIRFARNVDFRNYKRATLRRRVERRIAELQCSSVDEYVARIEQEPKELDTLITSMFIKVTRFFRDEDIWAFLKERVLPELLASPRPTQSLRIWCAGCATGEEAFSIAMLVAEALGPSIGSWDVKIFGTDVDEAAIAFARRATYSAHQMDGVSTDRVNRWFVPAPEGYAIRKEIRRLVVFGVNNLVSDAPISRLDLVLCRNVFIYLDSELQKRVIMRFHYALRHEGVLVLGRSELIAAVSRVYQPLDLSRRTYRKVGRKDVALSPNFFTNETAPAPAAALPEAPREEPPAASHFFQDILDSLPVPIIVTGVDGEVTFWGSDAARVWGRPDKEVLGKKLSALGLPGLSGEMLIEKTASVRDGLVDRAETDGLIAIAGRGEPAVMRVEVSPLRDASDQVVGLLYVLHDVTALRTLERDMRHVNAELKISNEKLQAANEELQAANEELETTNEELQSANEELQTTNEELQSANEELETTNEELQSTNVELDATNRELAHRTDEMNVLGFYQRTIIRSLTAAVIVMDNQGRITLWNVAAERLLGVTEVEAVGQTFWTLRIPALRRPVTVQIRKALREDRAFRSDEMKYDLATGGYGYANLAALPLIEGKNNMGAVIIFEDVTRLIKLAERRLREKMKGAGRLRAAAAGGAVTALDSARSEAVKTAKPSGRGASSKASEGAGRGSERGAASGPKRRKGAKAPTRGEKALS